jgi:pyridoxal phosphate enzyme (YggS family)
MENNKFLSIKEELKNFPNGRLLAVSKTRSIAQILNLFQNGQIEFGENRVDELVEKSQQIDEKILWHFIGRLQTNKITKLFSTQNLLAIHSVDRLSLVEALIKKEDALVNPLQVYLQFNTSGEQEKAGFESEAELEEAIHLLKSAQKLVFHGLMTMGKIRTDDPLTDARHCFKKLADIKNSLINRGLALESTELSMGMSGDYKIALEEGANVIRVGSALFT